VRRDSDLWRIKPVLGRARLHRLDLRDKAGVEKTISKIRPRIIFHCATYGGYPRQQDLDSIIQSNVTGTVNLLEACIKFKFDCFVNSGSSSEYGIKQAPMKETDLPEPASAYGAAKASATLFCQAVAKREGLPLVTLRLFSPYGYYEDAGRLIPQVITSCLNKKGPRLSSPYSVRDFVFIEDVISAYLKAGQQGDKIGSQVFNIAGGRQYSVGQVADKIIKLIPSAVKPLWGSILNPRIEPRCWEADIRKASKLLKWEPACSLESGLKKTVQWFKENRNLYDGKS
jgi:nucleoside-diphosphate-sugar epimerase